MAKSGSIKCPRCERTFSMPAHLGRHMATIHGARSPGKPAGGRRGRPPSAAALGPVGFDARAWRDQLIAQQGRIDAQLAAVSRLLQTLGA
ncbi:MAG: hypothetical protein AB1716_12440, partial [Planctomycetota bacterium]